MGDHDREVAALIEEHLDLVRHTIRRKRRWRDSRDREDIEQVGVIGLIAAARRFDPARGYKFATYAKHRIAGEVRDWERLMRGQERRRGDLVEPDPVGRDDPVAMATALDLREELLRSLPERTARMAQLYFFEGIPGTEIARRFNVTQGRVSQLMADVRQRLRELIA